MFKLVRAQSAAQLQIVALLDYMLFVQDQSPCIESQELYSEHVSWWLAYQTRGTWLKDEVTEHPVGFCGMWLPPTKYVAAFTRAGVLQHCRSKGLQKQMIQARIKHAKKLGYDTVETYVHGDNVASTKALLSCGFVPHKASQNRREGLWLHVSAPTQQVLR